MQMIIALVCDSCCVGYRVPDFRTERGDWCILNVNFLVLYETQNLESWPIFGALQICKSLYNPSHYVMK